MGIMVYFLLWVLQFKRPSKGLFKGSRQETLSSIGALLIGVGFWGPLCYTYNKEPQNSIGNYLGPDFRFRMSPIFHN